MSFFRYPGGKTKIRSQIVDALSNYVEGGIVYVEPFFGGGSIGLQFLKENNSRIKYAWINDKDLGIAKLWNAVIHYPQELKQKILKFVPSTSEFFRIKNKLLDYECYGLDYDTITIGFDKLAIHQMSYSGLGVKSGGPLGGVDQRSKYKIDCRWSPQYLCNKIDKLHEFFKTVTLIPRSCTTFSFETLLLTPYTNKVLFYLDPPYYVKGNDLYQYGFRELDHKKLADILKDTNHKWILSYDDCQEIRQMYEWAHIETLKVNYTITALKNKVTGKRKSNTQTELLICPE